jgi:hypothetical protein
MFSILVAIVDCHDNRDLRRFEAADPPFWAAMAPPFPNEPIPRSFTSV